MLDHLSLESSSEFPAFYTVFYTVLLCFSLSCIIAYTHYKTSRDIVVPVEFLQSLILVSIVSATVMQAIGDSLARGLGMLGALAIIRYRVTLKTPRNMVFTFAALAAGISCGVYAFIIALTGTLGFCAIAFSLRLSPLSKPNALLGTLKFDLPIDENIQTVESIIKKHSDNYRKLKFQIGKNKKIPPTKPDKDNPDISDLTTLKICFDYEVSFKNLDECKQLHRAMSSIESVSQLKLSFENINENV
jgi:hypothetical protein